MAANVIHSIEICGLWRKLDFLWKELNPDVNVLIGINGSGKTTLFNIIDSIFTADVKRLKAYGVRVNIKMNGTPLSYDTKTTVADLKKQLKEVCYQKISTFDVPMKDRPRAGKEFSQLYNELYDVVYKIGGEEPSFSDYRLKATNFPDQAESVNNRIRAFYDTVNRLFAKTGKTICIDPYTNHLIFMDGDEVIPLYKLSSGEKQLLVILLKVFLMEEKPYILLMDEPEISLHIEWQYRLFEEVRKLNPNCQIITSTHSPSLFGDGWGDKLFFVEDLIHSTH
ncbi:ATP-binding protein [Porphyromonadaceae bacterium OttesenSCG-928-L07]|nr:ATP-binding protein [Porphyromonadaceae bacterium OttesenSCG-928-L07]MDL2251876.1 ATP-binding protein [Odoribacter sp. OttesenSCG-928-J03]MDL2330565.1 ATP-binding protein [Odoribacter sp. OttesenSCG-928-A06]